MMVKTYSYALDKNVKLTDNFKVKEFRCKDGTDTILIDSDLVNYLQTIRNSMKSTSVTLSSGYRTEAYNKKIGGSTSSKHCMGRAADFCVKRGLGIVPSVRVACLAEILGIPGIEIISSTYLHCDTRTTSAWRSIQGRDGDTRTYTTLSALGYKSFFTYGKVAFADLDAVNPFKVPTFTLQKGDTGDTVKWLQWELVEHGYMAITINGKCSIDGSFGSSTEKAFREFQLAYPETYQPSSAPDLKCGGTSRRILLSL